MTTLPVIPGTTRRKRIPAKVKLAVAALIEGKAKNVAAAAEIAECSRAYIHRELARPHVAVYLRERVSRAVSLASGRAAARLEQLLDAGSEHVSLDAAKHVLAIAGVKPAADAHANLNVNVQAVGYIIDLTPQNVAPERQNKLKVIDHDS